MSIRGEPTGTPLVDDRWLPAGSKYRYTPEEYYTGVRTLETVNTEGVAETGTIIVRPDKVAEIAGIEQTIDDIQHMGENIKKKAEKLFIGVVIILLLMLGIGLST